MERIKAMECPVRLTVSQWGEILKCLKQHHSDANAIFAAEKDLRTQIDNAVEQCRDQLYQEIFDYEDPEEETKEFRIVRVSDLEFDDSIECIEDEPSTISLAEELPEENGLCFDDDGEEAEMIKEGPDRSIDILLMAFLCVSFLGFVTTVLTIT